MIFMAYFSCTFLAGVDDDSTTSLRTFADVFEPAGLGMRVPHVELDLPAVGVDCDQAELFAEFLVD
jgi:hypothetical protein